jgi:hypothetical protein
LDIFARVIPGLHLEAVLVVVRLGGEGEEGDEEEEEELKRCCDTVGDEVF